MKNSLTKMNSSLAAFSLLKPRAIMVSALMVTTSWQVQAQWTNENVLSYDSYDMKHYATSAYTGSDEYVMAGTVFNYMAPDDQAIHVLRIDNTGATALSKIINTNQYDERVIGVHTPNDGSRDAIIVASRRYIVPAPGIDGIEILRIDAAGNVSPLSDNIESSDPTYFNMYPMGSLLLDDQLYICGYVTQTLGIPDLTTEKVAFVLRYDLSLNVVAAVRTFEFGTGTPGGLDPDMAMRMKLLSSGLWVGGSCWDCPMMNMVLNPTTLFPTVPLPFRNERNGNAASSYWESSFDVLEDPATGGVYVFGNLCNVVNNHMMPRFLFIDGYDKNFLPYGAGSNRWQFHGFDYAWGTNIVPSLANDNTIILSGFESNRSCNGGGPTRTSTSNINPFLFQVQVRMAGGDINVTPYWWNSLLSYSGTGNDALTNSYYSLGYGQSGLDYGPVNTVRDLASTTEIVLNAPVWNADAGRLNIKWIRADKNGELFGCDWQPACEIIASVIPVTANGAASNSPININTYGNNDITDAANPDRENLCSDMVYKTLGTSSIESQSLLTGVIYPNPATDQINLKLNGGNLSVTDRIQVSITDMMGRTMGNLYQGALNGLPKSLSLPAMSSGIYAVNIYRNGSKVLTLPLTKQ
jgi:hypothetical protein